ncbi:hypothetical protein [Dietzia sp. UBA5065]|uniref:hypothetical protein n=1 Tax=Dietzia sp. UBA5065 TaxID=1946422 RepID=UPI0025C0FED9|nr:hypothetical protein [Dietzia sp. UBA5065]HMT48510.1 hypothetical protein [Dietzia sp.]
MSGTRDDTTGEPPVGRDRSNPGGTPDPDGRSRRPRPAILALAGEFLRMSRTTAVLLIAFVLTGALYLLVREQPVVGFGPAPAPAPATTEPAPPPAPTATAPVVDSSEPAPTGQSTPPGTGSSVSSEVATPRQQSPTPSDRPGGPTSPQPTPDQSPQQQPRQDQQEAPVAGGAGSPQA